MSYNLNFKESQSFPGNIKIIEGSADYQINTMKQNTDWMLWKIIKCGIIQCLYHFLDNESYMLKKKLTWLYFYYLVTQIIILWNSFSFISFVREVHRKVFIENNINCMK